MSILIKLYISYALITTIIVVALAAIFEEVLPPKMIRFFAWLWIANFPLAAVVGLYYLWWGI